MKYYIYIILLHSTLLGIPIEIKIENSIELENSFSIRKIFSPSLLLFHFYIIHIFGFFLLHIRLLLLLLFLFYFRFGFCSFILQFWLYAVCMSLILSMVLVFWVFIFRIVLIFRYVIKFSNPKTTTRKKKKKQHRKVHWSSKCLARAKKLVNWAVNVQQFTNWKWYCIII